MKVSGSGGVSGVCGRVKFNPKSILFYLSFRIRNDDDIKVSCRFV